MNYRELMLRCWRERRLLSLMVEMTYACDLRCAFCYNEKERNGRRLTVEKYDELLRDGRREGALYLTLTGGEPTLHPHFYAVGRMATEAGYSVRVKTNAHALDQRAILRMRDEVRPFNVDVSIHGATAATHDALTRVPGSFHRAVANIRSMVGHGMRVRMKVPLTRHNEHEIAAIFALGADLGVGIDSVPEITPTDTGDLSPLTLAPSPEGIRAWYRAIAAMAAQGESTFLSEEETDRAPVREGVTHACGAGVIHVTVDPFGEVYPCVAWRQSLGNLWEAPLGTIWRSRSAWAVEEQNREAGARKARVPGLEGELFCPGRALAQYGNPLTIYPEAVMIARLKREVVSERQQKEIVHGNQEAVRASHGHRQR
jgi:MoaA/NifB/PqqE/SkfB family radical SAM enzyme